MMRLFQRAVSRLPRRTQQSLRRWHYARQIRRGAFRQDEPEFPLLRDWVASGDWVLDVGANVGRYTIELSGLVGSTGRVLSFEPVPDTFEMLVANVSLLPRDNVSLFNVAASATTAAVAMGIPTLQSGLRNYYEAGITSDGGDVRVLSMAVDALALPQIRLIKIDVEGHELQALRGMHQLLTRDHPRLIVEGASSDVAAFLRNLGYTFVNLPRSPNRVFTVEAR